MKTNLIKFICFSFALGIFSCSTDNEEPIAQHIKPDFFIEMRLVHDMVAIDNSLYVLEMAQEFSDDGVQSNPVYIKKISKDGSVTIMNDMLPFRSFNSTDKGGITITPDGRPICVSYDKDVFYNFNEDLDELYERQVPSLVTDDASELSVITAYDNDSFIVYDRNASVLRGFDYQMNATDFEIGNPGNSAIADGVGSEVSFSRITKILVDDSIIYVVDDNRHLRKITNTAAGFKVETIANSTEIGGITDFTIDKSSNEFVLSIEKITPTDGISGLYSLAIDGGDTFDLMASSSVQLDITDFESKNQSKVLGLGLWGTIDQIHIDQGDLYFEQHDNIIKISDFRSKI